MRVVLEVVGGEEYEFDVESATYAELLDEIGLSPNEVAVFVDDRPVPEDQAAAAGRARVLRLVAGGNRRPADATGDTPAPPRRRPRGRSRVRRRD